MKKLIRDICTREPISCRPRRMHRTRTTIRSSRTPLRRLRADVLLDSIASATGVTTAFNNYPTGFRALQLYEGGARANNYFLKTFGISST